MIKINRTIAAGIVLLLAAILGLLALGRNVTLVVDGQSQTVHSNAWTVGGVLKDAGITPGAQDELTPAAGQLLWKQPIALTRAKTVQIWVTPGDEKISIITTASTANEMLTEAGITLHEGDRLLLNGQPITLQAELPFPLLVIQVRRAVALQVQIDGEIRELTSSADTLGAALDEAGIILRPADALQPAASTPLTGDMNVTLRRAVPLTIRLQDSELQAFSSATTVGAALAEVGVALQGMDMSEPAEDQPLPADGIISVKRVQEEVVVTTSYTPYGKQYIEDPETELDQTSVITPGSQGVLLSRERVRYVDGVEVARTAEAQWQARAPVDEQIGMGTKVVIRTLDTPGGTIEYWRAVNVYITSYKPCVPSGCSYITASGATLQKGIIAVSDDWYPWMAGQRLYVPDYGIGVVADYGYGIAGKQWIDVGYSDADYVGWHYYRTIYFLTPVPDNIPWILP